MAELRMLATIALAALVTGCATQSAPARDVVVVARGMVFFVEGQGQSPNPVIQVRSGERIRLVLKNEAPGLLHDLVIPAWNVEVEEIRAGETAETTFVVPDTPGRFEYSCRPHSAMMSGVIEVTR